MTINDLKTGHIVEMKDGTRGFVVLKYNNIILGECNTVFRKNTFNRLSSFRMKSSEESTESSWTITKVYTGYYDDARNILAGDNHASELLCIWSAADVSIFQPGNLVIMGNREDETDLVVRVNHDESNTSGMSSSFQGNVIFMGKRHRHYYPGQYQFCKLHFSLCKNFCVCYDKKED
jgi:hypothetical protein